MNQSRQAANFISKEVGDLYAPYWSLSGRQ
jgi:hypothetical protein